MNWQSLILELIFTVLSAFGVWVLTKVNNFVSTKISNGKARSLMEAAISIVSSVVKATYQTCVEGVKGTDEWTKDKQKEVLRIAINAAKSQLCAEVKSFIEQNYGDLDAWLESQIEAEIYTLKATNGVGDNESN